MPAKSHFLLLSSAFIAPMAAKQGGEKRLNIKNARAATRVIPKVAATVSALPAFIASSSRLKRLEMPKHTASVATTFSFAIKPVTQAAANCHATTPTIGATIYAIGVATVARIEAPAFSSVTVSRFQVKLCIR